jgi:hypothetical protein
MPSQVDRREFLKTATAVALTGAAHAAPSNKESDSETLVATLYRSFTDEQKKAICFPFDHALRSKVDANWQITPHKIGQFYTRDQRAMIDEIFRKLHNPDFFPQVVKHMHDDGGGIDNYAIAMFGEPSSEKGKPGQFEFVLTGRHCTVRCDGDSVEGAAFGGPIFYGHQGGSTALEAAEHPGNVYWYQAKRANEVFQALDGKQRETALITRAPRAEASNKTVQTRTKAEGFVGLPVADMTRDQRKLVDKVLADLLLPFRKRDVDEAMKYVKKSGGVSSMSMSFYKNLDNGNDGVWDVWQLENDKMVWYFRGHPHVHTWVNLHA